MFSAQNLHFMDWKFWKTYDCKWTGEKGFYENDSNKW